MTNLQITLIALAAISALLGDIFGVIVLAAAWGWA